MDPKFAIGICLALAIALGGSIAAVSALTEESPDEDTSSGTSELLTNETGTDNETGPEPPVGNCTDRPHDHHHGMRDHRHPMGDNRTMPNGTGRERPVPPDMPGNGTCPDPGQRNNRTVPGMPGSDRPGYRSGGQGFDLNELYGLLENLTRTLGETNQSATCPNCGTQFNLTSDGWTIMIFRLPQGFLIYIGQ